MKETHLLPSWKDFLNEKEIFESELESALYEALNFSKNFERGCVVLNDYISKFTGYGFIQIGTEPEVFKDPKTGQETYGYHFYSTKGPAISYRVNKGQSGKLVGSIDIFLGSDKETAAYRITSSINLMKAVRELAQTLKDPEAAFQKFQKLQESFIYEEITRKKDLTSEQISEIEERLSRGETVKNIAKNLNISYDLIWNMEKKLRVGKSKPSEIEIKNEQTLEDKVLFHEAVMDDVKQISKLIATNIKLGKTGKKYTKSLLITGRAGTGKTFNVEKALEEVGLRPDKDYYKLTGALSTVELYKRLFDFRDQLIVFDDADAVFSTEDSRNILKGALDSKEHRVIGYNKKASWLYDPVLTGRDPDGPRLSDFKASLDIDGTIIDDEDEEASNATTSEDGQYPNRFEFRGAIIFVSNLKKEKADPDGAIQSRSVLINVNPDDATMVEYLRRMLPYMEPMEMSLDEKIEIFELIKNVKGDALNMRLFEKAALLKLQGLSNWKGVLMRHFVY